MRGINNFNRARFTSIDLQIFSQIIIFAFIMTDKKGSKENDRKRVFIISLEADCAEVALNIVKNYLKPNNYTLLPDSELGLPSNRRRFTYYVRVSVAPTTTALLKLHLLQGWGCWNDLEYKDYLTKNEELSPYSQINSHKAVEEELVRESTRLNLELEQQKAVFENMNRNLQQEVDNLKLRSIEDEEIYDSTFYEYETKFASLQADLSVANDAYEKIKREYDETIFVLRELKCEMAAMTRNNEGRKTSSRELRDRVNRLEKREEELSARNTYLQESLDESNLQKNELKIILDDKVKATLAIEDELINVKAKYDSLDAIARDLQLENLHLRGEILKLQGRLPLKSEVKHYRTRSVSHVREEAYKESILAEEKDKVRKRVKNIKFQDLLMKATWIILLKEGIKLAALKEVICEELVVGTSKHKEFIRTFTDFELESLSFDQ